METNDSLQTLKREIELSYLVINRAINGCSEQIAYQLRLLGKRASARWVRTQGERQPLRRAVFQENYKRWICSFFLAGNIEGADLLITDLETFIRRVKQFIRAKDYSVDAALAAELMTMRQKLDLILAA